MSWLPIESATKDGPVLLWGTDEQAVVGEWLNCASPYWLTGLIGDHDSAYTHWLPLPAPPEGE